jgi:hypothetical protein
MQKTEARLQQRTDALERSRSIMAKQKEIIAGLQAKKP